MLLGIRILLSLYYYLLHKCFWWRECELHQLHSGRAGGVLDNHKGCQWYPEGLFFHWSLLLPYPHISEHEVACSHSKIGAGRSVDVDAVFICGLSLFIQNWQELSTPLPHLAKLSGMVRAFAATSWNSSSPLQVLNKYKTSLLHKFLLLYEIEKFSWECWLLRKVVKLFQTFAINHIISTFLQCWKAMLNWSSMHSQDLVQNILYSLPEKHLSTYRWLINFLFWLLLFQLVHSRQVPHTTTELR